MILRYDQGMNTHTDTNVQIIENATLDDVRPGDHITGTRRTWGMCGVTYFERCEGVAHHRHSDGRWETAQNGWLPNPEGNDVDVTITIRRTILNGGDR